MPSTRYPRHSDGLDFDRVLFFTDAVFAIAMTLLVVEIGVPAPLEGAAARDPGAMLDILSDKVPLVAAFFIGCFVIGSYWVAHHRFMTWLGAVDAGFIGLTVLYLAFVAVLPFPTGVLGEFGDNPISVVAFAVNMGAVSTMEGVLFRHARRRRPFREEWPEAVYRWERRASMSPVLRFAPSVPIAFVAPRLAILVWFLTFPLGRLLDRRRPAPSAFSELRVASIEATTSGTPCRRMLSRSRSTRPVTATRAPGRRGFPADGQLQMVARDRG